MKAKLGKFENSRSQILTNPYNILHDVINVKLKKSIF